MTIKTEPLYARDAYMKELKTKIISQTDEGIITESTIFYPRGGGQPEDRGVIIVSDGTEYQVNGLKREGDAILHKIDTISEISGEVTMRIDWDYRYKLMQHHTVLHILSAVVNQRFSETKVTGGHIYHNKARLDFDLDVFNKTIATELVYEINEQLNKKHQVSISFKSREEAERIPELFRTTITLPESIKDIRIVKIGDIDIQADGGLHVDNTGEIGRVELVGIDNKGKGRKRITIKVVE